MLHIPAHIGPSEIHGIGVFTNQKIKAGELVWRYNMFLDSSIQESELAEMPQCQQNFLRKHCYINAEQLDVLVICADLAKFINFSDNANLVFGEKTLGEYDLLADRDIEAGEEITVYPESDADYTRKMATS